MSVVQSAPVDVSEWIESIPEGAPLEWCLPAYGGRVIVRGYDTLRSDLAPMAGSHRWMVDCSLVPLTPGAAKRTDGPHGAVFPGDCVVYFGGDDQRTEAHLWYPQRVIHTVPEDEAWQRVWSVRDTSESTEYPTDEGAAALPEWMRTNEPLHGDERRRALELFWLNVDCPGCGARGRSIMYGLPAGPPGPHVVIGGCLVDLDNPTYACQCGAEWRVQDSGELVLTRSSSQDSWG